MDKRIAGLLGAAAALTTMTGARRARRRPTELAPVTSYRDLLDPVPNALCRCYKADDARLARDAGRPRSPRSRCRSVITTITTIIIMRCRAPGQGITTTIIHHHHHHHH